MEALQTKREITAAAAAALMKLIEPRHGAQIKDSTVTVNAGQTKSQEAGQK